MHDRRPGKTPRRNRNPRILRKILLPHHRPFNSVETTDFPITAERVKAAAIQRGRRARALVIRLHGPDAQRGVFVVPNLLAGIRIEADHHVIAAGLPPRPKPLPAPDRTGKSVLHVYLKEALRLPAPPSLEPLR